MKDEDQLKEQLELAQKLKELEAIAKSRMTKEAIARYGNLKLAHPEIAVKAIAYIAQAVQSGQLLQIDDILFKKILKEI